MKEWWKKIPGETYKRIDQIVPGLLEEVSQKIAGALIPRGDNNTPYLYRYYLEPDGEDIRCFLHKFVSSDAIGELHSHPWEWSVSIILAGAYVEHRTKGWANSGGSELSVKHDVHHPLTVQLGKHEQKMVVPFDVNHIQHDDFHRVELCSEAVWTLFVHGPRKFDWGFVKEEYETEQTVRVIQGRTFDRPEVNEK